MNIQDKLIALRKEHDLTQKELGEIAGVSGAAVSAWELGDRSPKIKPLKNICAHFGLDIHSFIDESADFEDEKTLTPEGERQISEDDIRAAFFGGADDLSEEEMDAMWNDAKDYIQYKLEQRRRKKNGGAD